ncbi:hypothetical protein Btru_067361 [Bulinus truncatus]|nr:hypothetical protein Btru_067361 [Bulinus truncatus]
MKLYHYGITSLKQLTMDEANIMKMFETFDFENDVNFQAGWKIISEQIDERNKGLTFIQAKVFYFNKHVARLDFDNYMSWIKTDYKTHVKTDRSQSYSVTADTSSTKVNIEKLNQVQGDSKLAVSYDQTEEECDLSFSQKTFRRKTLVLVQL